MATFNKGQILYRKDDPNNKIRVIDHAGGIKYKCLQNGHVGYIDIHIDKWVALNPDGLITIATVLLDQSDLRDVIVSLFKNGKKPDPMNPDVLCRQCVQDIFAALDGNTNKFGISISQITTPNDIPLEKFMAFKKHTAFYTIMVYNTDTLDEILKILRVKRPDTYLRNNAPIMQHYFKNYSGVCTNLRELLESNEFMRDFHSAFGIIEVPFSLKDPELVPKSALAKIVAGELHKTPDRVYVTKYDKSVDLNQIKRPYILATADSSKAAADDKDIYLVAIDENPNIKWSDFIYQDDGGIEAKLKNLGW